jgi:hypothetical protein
MGGLSDLFIALEDKIGVWYWMGAELLKWQALHNAEASY